MDKEILERIANHINKLPEQHKFFSKVEKIVGDRKQMIEQNRVDWAMAELMAYGSLILEGHPVRVSGQDSFRGTFAHRHTGFIIDDTDQNYVPLHHLDENQAMFNVYNSPLSEYGVLGFEYGYALATPNGLTVWEAQFGDFSNVAQVIIDQYISSAEEKWGLMNGITLLLPHGYEGQGPEHSSARIERFLSLCARNNMQVVNCTTPANLFHVLRKQLKRNFRIPLIIFTPKSLLHVAPSPALFTYFNHQKNLIQIAGTKYNAGIYYSKNVQKLDITRLDFKENSFDIIICNHVLEHIEDEEGALSEIIRVLKVGGWAMLQVPISSLLKQTLENKNIKTPEERANVYGQKDHVRLYGDDYSERLEKAGFIVTKIAPNSLIEDIDLFTSLSVNKDEYLYIATKP